GHDAPRRTITPGSISTIRWGSATTFRSRRATRTTCCGAGGGEMGGPARRLSSEALCQGLGRPHRRSQRRTERLRGVDDERRPGAVDEGRRQRHGSVRLPFPVPPQPARQLMARRGVTSSHGSATRYGPEFQPESAPKQSLVAGDRDGEKCPTVIAPLPGRGCPLSGWERSLVSAVARPRCAKFGLLPPTADRIVGYVSSSASSVFAS